MSFKIWESVDNTDRGEKIVIRQRLLSEIQNPSVLECFAGSGHIWRECYQGLPYLGLDIKPISDGRTILKVDNRKYLRAADLSQFNFFDLDAHGSPWHQFLIVLHRRRVMPGERIAVAITDGLNFKMRMSGLPDGLRSCLNIPPGLMIPNLHLHQEFINAKVVTATADRHDLRISLALCGTNPRKNMRYYGIVLEKK
ncbi:MAG: hypothetical protein AB9919_06840 [Geobacteraceae bacterium]